MKPNEILEFLRVAADFAILETNDCGIIRYASPAVRSIFSKQEGEVEGVPLHVLIPELTAIEADDFEPVQARGAIELMDNDDIQTSDCQYLEFLAAQNQQGNRYETEVEIDGQFKWLELAVYKVLSDESLVFATIISEITRRKKQQQEIKALNENLEHRVEERTKQIKNVVISCGKQLEQVNQTYQTMKEKQMEIIEQIEFSILSAIPTLSDDISDKIHQVLRGEMIKCMQFYSEDQITDQQFLLSIMTLKELFDSSAANENLKPGQLSGTSQNEVDDLLESLGI